MIIVVSWWWIQKYIDCCKAETYLQEAEGDIGYCQMLITVSGVEEAIYVENKICFITSVNDVDKYNEALEYLQRLHVPEGMIVESIVIQNADSMTAAYQEAMLNSDAKYKIYMHQDVFIVQHNFLDVMVEQFRKHPDYGIMGVVGSSSLTETGVWWEGERIGAICDNHTGEMQNYSYTRNVHESLEAVVLDGVVLMTQYDVDWRTDLFRKWHFYDASQCMEFRLRGYKAGVIPQVIPSCIHNCGGWRNKMIGYDEERMKFLTEYVDSLMEMFHIS